MERSHQAWKLATLKKFNNRFNEIHYAIPRNREITKNEITLVKFPEF